MSDGLTISGGGSYAVASDALLADAEALGRIADETAECAAAVVSIDTRTSETALRRAGVPGSAFEAEIELERAVAAITAARWRAAGLATALRAAAEGYGRAERASSRAAQELAAAFGFGVGRLLPVFAAFVAPALPAIVAGVVVAAVLAPGVGRRAREEAGTFLTENNRMLTNPLTVALVRSAVMSVDDVIGGAVGLPPAVMRAIGDEGAGLVGLDTSAAAVVALGAPAGLLAETAVATRAGRERSVATAPAGLAQRLDRLPQRTRGDDGAVRGSHIRIERYSMPDGVDRFEVYITGTADFSPVAGTEPFDLTSDVAGIAELPAGSVRAVQQAMADAGVTADSPVVFNGFSQGGLVAASLAASDDYNTHGVFTAGAPTAQADLPSGVPIVALEHTDDLVPALGGTRDDLDAVLVEREAFAGRQTPDGVALPAHDRDEYRTTAELADRARSTRLTGVVDRLDAFGAGATSITSTSYVAERVRG
jgi:hypothetical protein